MASIFTLLVVAFERYFAVVHPYGNRGKLTFRKVKVCFFEIRYYAGRNLSTQSSLVFLLYSMDISYYA